MKWKYFIAACLVVGAALFKAGAPLFAILAGITFAGVVNWQRHRASKTVSSARRDRAMAKAR